VVLLPPPSLSLAKKFQIAFLTANRAAFSYSHQKNIQELNQKTLKEMRERRIFFSHTEF